MRLSCHEMHLMSLDNPRDTVYFAARLEFQNDVFFSFVSVSPSQRFMDPTPLAADPGALSQPQPQVFHNVRALMISADDHNNPDDTPGKRVRQQTGDVITLLRTLQVQPRGTAA